MSGRRSFDTAGSGVTGVSEVVGVYGVAVVVKKRGQRRVRTPETVSYRGDRRVVGPSFRRMSNEDE